MQKFKSLYFQDFPANSPSQKNLTLAFSDKDLALYERVKPLSSQELRTLLGYEGYGELRQGATEEGLPLNTYCIRLLRKRLYREIDPSGQPSLPGIDIETTLDVDPIHSTFRGGEAEPLHTWYPLLEGYSPKFVQGILKAFAAHAKTVFDPFAGTGTTVTTTMSLGLQGYYCEVNPLLQLLIQAKVSAYKLAPPIKQQVAARIRELESKWHSQVGESQPDLELDNSYQAVFRKSVFFDPQTYALILRTRTAIDRIAIGDQVLADFVTIAVLASLLPSSKLIRAGDIRYRTEKELERRTSFEDETRIRLHSIADDLDTINTQENGDPVLLCEDARNLNLIPPQGFDAVVTSPPYLNGTNYFRNSKMELWFLRSLRTQEDLAAFRFKAVTSGINDVTVGKISGDQHPAVAEMVSRLELQAYDKRIPQMVSGYFSDMKRVFQGLKKHLNKNATIAIDLGDSVYGGIHVPTDKLLVSQLEDLGYLFERSINLRRRLSRDRTELRQVLLIFKNAPSGRVLHEGFTKLSPSWTSTWGNFKEKTPYKNYPYSKRNWGHPLHSLCSYQGKMKPALAHFLVKTFVPRGGRMLDPFAGVGTIPFEAALEGIESYGFDISPAALAIAKGKVEQTQVEKCEQLISSLEKYLHAGKLGEEDVRSANSFGFNGKIPDYFHPKTLRDVLLARRFFLENPPLDSSASLVFASLLHILHGNRPYALSRRSHPITPYKPTGEFEHRPLIPRLREKVMRSLETPKPEVFVKGKIFHQDATSWWPQEVKDLDAIITSPPFFDSTRFHIGNWMRLWFCGWERKDFDEKPLAFVDERQKLSFEIYGPIFRQARERLKDGGVFVIHSGESVKCNMAKELSAVAKRWFRVVDIFTEDVTRVEHHGIRDKGTVTAHQFLVLE